MTRIVGVLLAAGSAKRFGTNKLLTKLPSGEPVGLRAARNLVEVLPDSIAVVRPGDEEVSRMLASAGLEVLVNPKASTGIASSIASGVLATGDADGWIIALADMPWILPATIRSLADALQDGANLAAPTYGGRRGHPVGFSAEWRSRLSSLSGDRGARDLLEEAPAELLLLPTNDSGILRDIDLRADLEPSKPG